MIKANQVQEDYEDIFQIGCIGLIKAGKTFDESKNIKFSTYATTCIKQEILKSFQLDKWYKGNQ